MEACGGASMRTASVRATSSPARTRCESWRRKVLPNSGHVWGPFRHLGGEYRCVEGQFRHVQGHFMYIGGQCMPAQGCVVLADGMRRGITVGREEHRDRTGVTARERELGEGLREGVGEGILDLGGVAPQGLDEGEGEGFCRLASGVLQAGNTSGATRPYPTPMRRAAPHYKSARRTPNLRPIEGCLGWMEACLIPGDGLKCRLQYSTGHAG